MNTSYLKYILLFGLILLCLPVSAQDYIMPGNNFSRPRNGKYIHVSGHVQMKEGETGKMAPLEQAAVRLYCLTDSTFNEGTATDREGNFNLFVFLERKKDYELQVSYIGTNTYKLKLANKDDLYCDTITLKEMPITMEEAVIVAKLKKMRILGDTTIFNPEAYHLTEGAVLLELVRRMPGLKLSNGKMTYQGKDISEILVNGEKFFADNIAIALQNLPTKVLKEVRIYDKQSDKAKATGVDDGERTTVMDLKTKDEMNDALMANASVNGATHHMYGMGGMINRFKAGGDHISVIANRRTTPNDPALESFSMTDGMGASGGNPMKQLSQAYGISAGQKVKKFDIAGSIDYSDNSTTTENYTINENYLPTGNTFSDQLNTSGYGNRSLGANFTANGELTEKDNLMVNLSYNDGKSNNLSENQQATYNRNPHDYTDSPLSQGELVPADSRINRTDQSAIGNSDTRSFNGSVMYIHKFNKERRNISFNLNTGVSSGKSHNFQRSTTHYYLLGDSVLYQNRFTLAPNNTRMYNARIAYNEPVTEKINLELSYEYSYNRNHRDENIFDLDKVSDSSLPLGKLPERYEEARIDSLSSLNNTSEGSHRVTLRSDIDLGKQWRMNAAFSVSVDRQRVYMLNQGTVTDTTLRSVNFSPSLSLFRFKGSNSFTMNYSGMTRQPGVNFLLPVVNNNNPLYITKGNTNLKPTFSHNLNINWRIKRVWINGGANQSFNEVTYKTDYNPTTGVRTNHPENINGNWSANINAGYSMEWDYFSIESNTGYNFSNQVSYVTSNQESHKNTVKNHNILQMLKGSYTPDWGELVLSGNMNLNRTKDNLETGTTSFNKTYSLQLEANVYLPLDLRLGTVFGCTFRRGFLSKDMNNTEPLWNASASWSFLKKKQAVLRLDVYDILQRVTNFYTEVNENGTVQMRSKGVNSYAILSFSYRFNLFKGKKSEEKE